MLLLSIYSVFILWALEFCGPLFAPAFKNLQSCGTFLKTMQDLNS